MILKLLESHRYTTISTIIGITRYSDMIVISKLFTNLLFTRIIDSYNYQNSDYIKNLKHHDQY